MLARMVEVNDLDSTMKVFGGNIPDPGCTVSKDNDAFGPLQAAPDSFSVDARAKLFGGFDRSHIGRRMSIPQWSSLIIRGRLSENASQFRFARFRPAVFVLALTAFGLVRHDRHTRSGCNRPIAAAR